MCPQSVRKKGPKLPPNSTDTTAGSLPDSLHSLADVPYIGSIDARTKAARLFKAALLALIADRGGVEAMSNAQLLLARRAAGAGISTRDLRSYHKHNEAARCEEAKEILEAGKSLALVSDSGTPLISDPGGRLVRTAIDRKATVVPVPGASAALAALVASGLDTSTFTFLGFVPKSGRERRSYIDSLKTMLRTAVLFESPQRLVDTLAELGGELGDDRAVVVGRELTKVHEEFFRGTLSEALAYYKEHAPRGEIVICLAAAAKAGAAENVEAARSLALEMAQGGSTSREIVRALRDRFGLERNRAYALALEAAEEGEE